MADESKIRGYAGPALVRLHDADNVVVAAGKISRGEWLEAIGIEAAEDIPAGHKIAATEIDSGVSVLKYGQVIGIATQHISAGAHVHVHNIAMAEGRMPAPDPLYAIGKSSSRTFMGYRRRDGKVGVRNYVCILSSVNCSATVAKAIGAKAQSSGLLARYPTVDGVVPIVHNTGCGMSSSGESYNMLLRTLAGTAANPNFGGVLIVGLGCEVMQVSALERFLPPNPGARLATLTIQGAGGTEAAVENGVELLEGILDEVGRDVRVEVPASALTIGLQCGGSDAWSGITANPALGNAADRLVAMGGTVILSETPEIFGAEHLLYARAEHPAVAEALARRMDWWRGYTERNGAEMNNNPSPGNIAGGLSTILEKSLGAVAKGGTSVLRDVIEYAEPLRKSGLVFMDSPGFDPCSATGQVASGATLIAFTTGRGSAFGYQPSPSIKIATNSAIARRMNHDMDIDCGPIADGRATVESKGEEILDFLLAVASGRQPHSERLGYGGSEFVPWQIGATM